MLPQVNIVRAKNADFLSGGFKFEAQRALVIDETPQRVF